MTKYQLAVYGYKRNGDKYPIGYEMYDNPDEAHLQGQATCDSLGSLTYVYAYYGYDVDKLDQDWRPQEVKDI